MAFSLNPFRSIEESFDPAWHHEWFQKYWWTSFILSAIYCVLVFGGQSWMESRPRYSLRTLLVLWNAGLGIFSILASIAHIENIYEHISTKGFHSSICEAGTLYHKKVGFWLWAFMISKAFELGDTAFIVLRKQKLIFLHWFHHILTLVYCWYSYREPIAPMRYFAVVNLITHSYMYSYYAARASGRFKIPRPINVSITCIQLYSMVNGCGLNAYVFYQLWVGNGCEDTYDNVVFSFIMYFIYLVLFMNFFYHTYINPQPKKVKQG